MTVLFLGPADSRLLGWLREVEARVLGTAEPIDGAMIERNGVEWLVSYGYRHILGRDVLERLPRRAVNLHISYLPWNRGADPNLWSWFDDTPKGVSIHFLDEGIDTGPVIARKKVYFGFDETLASSYRVLQLEIEDVFKQWWPDIKAGTVVGVAQSGRGSFHKKVDREFLDGLLAADGWDTSVEFVQDYGADVRMSVDFLDRYRCEIEELRGSRK